MFFNSLILKRQQLKNQINNLEAYLNEQKDMVEEAQNQLDNIEAQIKNKQSILDGTIELQECNYPFQPSDSGYEDLEKDINFKELHLSFLINNNRAIIITREYRLDGSKTKGEKFQRNYGKNLLTGFNSYISAKEKTLTQYNYYDTIRLINQSFNKFNNQGELMGINISEEYLETYLKILSLKLDIKIKKAIEKSRLREEKKKLKEQEKLLQEIEETKQKLVKERKQYETALNIAISDEEQTKIKKKLEEIALKEKDCDYRLKNANSGWLYIISNKALPGIIKLGCTRRLDPFIRIRELSSASLPYPFICHGLVFSDNVFILENNIHKFFDAERTNKDNFHKEFFNITPKEAIDVLKNEFKMEVLFPNEKDFNKE